MAAGINKFSVEDINKFSHKIENCLQDKNCRSIFSVFLEKLRRRDLLRVLRLWEKADGDSKLSTNFDEDAYLDIIEEIDDFNQNPFLSISECVNKYIFVKAECCRILSKILPQFVQHLRQYHRT